MSSACARQLRTAVFTTIVVLTFPAFVLAGAGWLPVDPAGEHAMRDARAETPPAVVIHGTGDSGLTLTVTTAGVLVESRTTARGGFDVVTWTGAAATGEVGTPAIPAVRRLIVAPAGATITVDAEPSEAIPLRSPGAGPWRLMPVQPPIEKIPGAMERAEFRFDEQAYTLDADVPAALATVEEFGTAAGQRLVALTVYPVAFNAARGALSLHRDIKVTVHFDGGIVPVERPAPAGLDAILLNPAPAALRAATGNYHVVTAAAYATDIQPFLLAKTAQGFDVTSWTAAAGTTREQIKAHLAGLWADPDTAPDYVLLVGDTNTIPFWVGVSADNPPTDLYYACMDAGDDWMPDFAIGRLPVRSSAQLDAVVDKLLIFENGLYTDPGYLLRAVFMSSEDNHAITEATHNWTINTHLEPANFISDKLFTHTFQATPQQVRNAFNAGRLFGIYSGHGGEFSWADGPPFSQDDVRGLFNDALYPFVCSFACLTGSYDETECFAETWIVSADKGAASIWASSVTSYWTEDDVLQKRLFDSFYKDYVREIGPAINHTRVLYATEMGSGATTRRYFEMYNLLGDPALYIPDTQAVLRVQPSDALHAEGPKGGPFLPASRTWQVRNLADYAFDYAVTIEGAPAWLELLGETSGTLEPGEVADVTAAFTAAAADLDNGPHTAAVVFTNITDHAGDTTRAVELEVGRYVFASSDVPKAITDYASVSSTLVVDQAFCIGDLDVSVDITHTYIGDLVVELRSPTGRTLVLHNQTGAGTDNLVAIFDDEGLTPSGPGTLAQFESEPPVGIWTLTVRDQANGDVGTLNAWSLRMLPAGDTCPPVAYDLFFETPVGTPLDVNLVGVSGGGVPLTFIIDTLPTGGVLLDPLAGTISAVPHELPGGGSFVRYQPECGWSGSDLFTYHVFDGQASPPADVNVEVGGPTTVHAFPLNTDPGWAREGAWAFGPPTGAGSYEGDPDSGHTGQNVFGYNLAGDYTNSMPVRYLTTNPIDCTQLSDVELHFWRWLGVESAAYDHASVEVSTGNNIWTVAWLHTGPAISDAQWQQMTLDISAIADGQPNVLIRWSLGPTDTSVTYPGWNIDDLEILAVRPPLPGDFDGDSVVNLADYERMAGCLNGPDTIIPVECACVDLDGDSDIDLSDIARFTTLFSIP